MLREGWSWTSAKVGEAGQASSLSGTHSFCKGMKTDMNIVFYSLIQLGVQRPKMERLCLFHTDVGRLCGRKDISVKACACHVLADGGGGIGTVLEWGGREEPAQRDRAGKDSS